MSEPVRGLRDRQKELKHRQILSAAGRLFAEKGFDATTMEEIAAASLSSVPTVYSYVTSKSDILFALFEIEQRSIEPAIRDMVAAMPEDPLEALVAIQMAVLCSGYDAFRKGVWREIAAAGVRASGVQRTRFIRLQELQIEWLAEAFEVLKSRGSLRATLPSEIAARVVYGVSRNNFLEFVVNEKMAEAELAENIRSELRVFLEGAR